MEHSRCVVKVIDDAKSSYFRSKVTDADPEEMFGLVKFLTSNTSKVLPTCDSDHTLANMFAEYFHSKVVKLQTLLNNSSKDTVVINAAVLACSLSQLEPVSSEAMNE